MQKSSFGCGKLPPKLERKRKKEIIKKKIINMEKYYLNKYFKFLCKIRKKLDNNDI
jgi:hypothetical protein